MRESHEKAQPYVLTRLGWFNPPRVHCCCPGCARELSVLHAAGTAEWYVRLSSLFWLSRHERHDDDLQLPFRWDWEFQLRDGFAKRRFVHARRRRERQRQLRARGQHLLWQ